MPKGAPVLHMICGKIAAGKSTLATQLAQEEGTVLIVLDDWLGALFADQMLSGADFLRVSERLGQVMDPHIIALLKAGVSVVLDYPANTVAQRARMRALFEAASVAHQLHVLDVPDEECLARLRARNAQGDHPFAVSEAQFHRFAEHFVLPTVAEGFTLVHHAK
ncbi:MAG: ATP-binding protein [Pseudomonadota bacterium]